MQNETCSPSVVETPPLWYRVKVWARWQWRRVFPVEGNLMRHAREELRIAGFFDGGEDAKMDAEMAKCVLAIIKTFSGQGHSGFSAGTCTSIVEKLMRFDPLMPLTGEDSEWARVGEDLYQNRRCSHVFKDEDGAYDLNDVVWKARAGCCYTTFTRRTPVVFPYTPTTEYRTIES